MVIELKVTNKAATINPAQLRDLFMEEVAIQCGKTYGVPAYRVRELFGDNAFMYLYEKHRDLLNCYGCGDYQCGYVTYEGFRIAATFHNVEIIRDFAPPSPVKSSLISW